jgi:hypothetical protein
MEATRTAPVSLALATYRIELPNHPTYYSTGLFSGAIQDATLMAHLNRKDHVYIYHGPTLLARLTFARKAA